jgi:hypothetical protein
LTPSPNRSPPSATTSPRLINSDPELDAPIGRDIHIAAIHSALEVESTSHSVHDRGKLDEDAVASGFDDPPTVQGNDGIDQLATKLAQALERAFLVQTGQPRIARHVGGKDRREAASNAVLPRNRHGGALLAYCTPAIGRCAGLRITRSAGRNPPGRRGSAESFPGRCGVDRERVHAALEFGGQHGVDHAVAFDSALPPEGIRYNIEAEMAFPAGPMPGMALMAMRFIDEPEAFRVESVRQFSCDEVADTHRVRLGSLV